jgi:hypothetical protein
MMSMNSSTHTVPSRAFQYVERKLSESDTSGFVNNRRNSSDVFAAANNNNDEFGPNKPPARERDQEAGPTKYKGTNIPSKTFKYLQYLTQNELVTNSTSSAATHVPNQQPAPVLKTAQVQVAPTEGFSGRKEFANLINNSNTQPQAVLGFSNHHLHANNPGLSDLSASDPNLSLKDATPSGPASLGVKSIMNRFNSNQQARPVAPAPAPMHGPFYGQNVSFSETFPTQSAAFSSAAAAANLIIPVDTETTNHNNYPTPASNPAVPHSTPTLTPKPTEVDLTRAAAAEITAAAISAAVANASLEFSEPTATVSSEPLEQKDTPVATTNLNPPLTISSGEEETNAGSNVVLSVAAADDSSLVLTSSISNNETTINLNETNLTTTTTTNKQNAATAAVAAEQPTNNAIATTTTTTTKTEEIEEKQTTTTVVDDVSGEKTREEISSEITVAQETIETSEF